MQTMVTWDQSTPPSGRAGEGSWAGESTSRQPPDLTPDRRPPDHSSGGEVSQRTRRPISAQRQRASRTDREPSCLCNESARALHSTDIYLSGKLYFFSRSSKASSWAFICGLNGRSSLSSARGWLLFTCKETYVLERNIVLHAVKVGRGGGGFGGGGAAGGGAAGCRGGSARCGAPIV